MSRNRKTAKIVVFAVVTPLVILALAFFALAYSLGAFRDNVAQDAVAPLANQLTTMGAHRLCDEGDAGYSPDNSQPWYKAFYQVPNAASARLAFLHAAATSGFPLVVDNTVPGQSHEETFISNTIKPEWGLTLVIYRNTTVTLDCLSGGNQKVRASGSGAIYEVDFASPPRQM